MDIFVKTAGLILITVILGVILSKQGKDYAIVLTVLACSLIGISALSYISPIIDFLTRLRTLGDLDDGMLTILLRSVGIGMLSEIVGHICADSGNAALGKVLQILSAAVMLWLSMPLFTALIDLVEEILLLI